MMSIADIRTQYSKKSLSEADALPDAMAQFEAWWKEAVHAQLTEVNAMTLATVSATGMPDARIVLLKDISKEGFSFFTNYESQKGKELAAHPNACLVFFWKELERQVRIRGSVSKLSVEDSSAYFFSRPKGSQIGAIVSPQSSVIASREVLEEKVKRLQEAVDAGQQLQKPDGWGGYLVQPESIEFWQGRPNRLHDRLLYTRQPGHTWTIERLAP